MDKNERKQETAQAVSASPAQKPEINEVDREPIYHADEEGGDGDE